MRWEIQELRGQEVEVVAIIETNSSARQALQLAPIPRDAKGWREMPTYSDDDEPIGAMLVDPEDKTHAYSSEPIV